MSTENKPPIADWDTIRLETTIDGVDYFVEAEIHLTSSGNTDKLDPNLQGWYSEPECQPPHPHFEKLEALVLNEIEERYG